MSSAQARDARPAIHLLASESDMVANLALRVEHSNPLVAAMLLQEIERAELHEPGTLPDAAITLGSEIDFIDERTNQVRSVKLVIPAEANIAEGKISILTPMGAALYGLVTGQSIDWPDLDGNKRSIRIRRVTQPPEARRSAA